MRQLPEEDTTQDVMPVSRLPTLIGPPESPCSFKSQVINAVIKPCTQSSYHTIFSRVKRILLWEKSHYSLDEILLDSLSIVMHYSFASNTGGVIEIFAF